ncbi:hypothetical protein ACJROX_06330 [Pseudalkalibacillus sp. A8]
MIDLKERNELSKQKFVDADTKAKIEEHLEKVNHKTATQWASDCAEL